MPDTPRTRAELLSMFADNPSGNISEQDLRDFVVSGVVAFIGGAANSALGLKYLTEPSGMFFRLEEAVEDPHGFIVFQSAIEAVSITATGGAFTLTGPVDLSYPETAPIAHNAGVSTVQSAIDAAWGSGIVTVGGSPLDLTLDWAGGANANQPFNQTIIGVGSLTGGSGQVSSIQDGGGLWTCPAGLDGVYQFTLQATWDGNTDGTYRHFETSTSSNWLQGSQYVRDLVLPGLRQTITFMERMTESTTLDVGFSNDSGGTRFPIYEMQWVKLGS